MTRDEWKKLYKNNLKDKDYREQVKKEGYKRLANAVLRQWHLDGEPKNCSDMIDLWLKVYKEI